MGKYRLITRTDDYSAEIYDNCDATLAVRQDGNRARIKYDTTVWHGNSGGLVRKVVYFDGRDSVRRVIRQLRRNQIRAIKDGESKSHFSTVLDIVEPRW